LNCFLLIVGPVACSKHFQSEVNTIELLGGRASLKVSGHLLRHLDIFEHHFESLGEVEAALFFEFQQKGSLGILVNLSLLKESFSET
jgi:hypothetical protein